MTQKSPRRRGLKRAGGYWDYWPSDKVHRRRTWKKFRQDSKTIIKKELSK